MALFLFFVHNIMMKRFEKKFNDFVWVDLIEPKKEDLRNLSKEFNIIDRIILNAMDPEHLPKYEAIENGLVLYLRVIDLKKKYKAINIQELTTKITIIIKGNLLLTLHRLDQEFLEQMRNDDSVVSKNRNEIIRLITKHALKSFDEALNNLEVKADEFEEKIFKDSKSKTLLREGYNLKRKASAFKKVMKFYSDTFQYMSTHKEYMWNDFQAEKEISDRLLFYIDDVQENISGVLNLHLAIASNKTNEASFKTNEVMRVLTVFSIFFLPLNFLVGVYGMNFKYMPELDHPYGYFAVLILMALVSIFIFGWVYKKGWLQDPNAIEEKSIN